MHTACACDNTRDTMDTKHPVFDKIEIIEDEDCFTDWLQSVEGLVGSVIMESTALEDELELLLYEWLTVGDGEHLPVILENLNFFKKIESATKIAERKLKAIPEKDLTTGDMSLIDEWRELSKRLEDARKSRNDIAHGSWLRKDKNKGIKVGVRRKKGDCELILGSLIVKNYKVYWITSVGPDRYFITSKIDWQRLRMPTNPLHCDIRTKRELLGVII
jgi:hypothetical protein